MARYLNLYLEEYYMIHKRVPIFLLLLLLLPLVIGAEDTRRTVDRIEAHEVVAVDEQTSVTPRQRLVQRQVREETPRPREIRQEQRQQIRKNRVLHRNVEIQTDEDLEITDEKITLKKDNKRIQIKEQPHKARYLVQKKHPGLAREVELIIENDKPVYKVRGSAGLQLRDKQVIIDVEETVDAQTGKSIKAKEVVQMVKDGVTVKERDDEIFLYHQDDIITLKDVNPRIKRAIRRKLTSDSIVPLVDVETLKEIQSPTIVQTEPKIHRFVLQTDKSCSQTFIDTLSVHRSIDTSDFTFLIVDTTIAEVDPLLDASCIISIGDRAQIQNYIAYAKRLLAVESENLIEDEELDKSNDDIEDITTLEDVLEADDWVVQPGQTSPYQNFIIPESSVIQEAVSGLTKEEIFQTVSDVVWISDTQLHNTPEKWLTPEELLQDTEGLSTNPTGRIASDCSEQANTLVSMLRASGIPSSDVRVALGLVDFGQGPGGHAWAEIKEDDKWMPIEATSGPFYDESTNQLIERSGTTFDYWRYHEYPVVEVWAYYNDEFFTDSSQEVAAGWSNPAETAIEEDLLTAFDDVKDDVLSALTNQVNDDTIKQRVSGVQQESRDVISSVVNWFRSLFG